MKPCRSAIRHSGLLAAAFVGLCVLTTSSCEVPADPFKNGQEQKVHDGGMHPTEVRTDTVRMERMDTATDPSMDGKP